MTCYEPKDGLFIYKCDACGDYFLQIGWSDLYDSYSHIMRTGFKSGGRTIFVPKNSGYFEGNILCGGLDCMRGNGGKYYRDSEGNIN